MPARLAIAEIMRAIVEARRGRASTVIGLIGGRAGCYGGGGLIAGTCSRLIVSEQGRHQRQRPRGDRDQQGRRGIRLARPRPGLAHDGRQAPLPDRRRRRVRRRRRRGVPRRPRSTRSADGAGLRPRDARGRAGAPRSDGCSASARPRTPSRSGHALGVDDPADDPGACRPTRSFAAADRQGERR